VVEHQVLEEEAVQCQAQAAVPYPEVEVGVVHLPEVQEVLEALLMGDVSSLWAYHQFSDDLI